jgi:hypothetical protein
MPANFLGSGGNTKDSLAVVQNAHDAEPHCVRGMKSLLRLDGVFDPLSLLLIW